MNDDIKIKCSNRGSNYGTRTMNCQATLYLEKNDKVGVDFSEYFNELSSKTYSIFEGALLKKDI